ncbi:unnamed protein product [Linum trigynum]|uniref:Reverse transcriptase zinc-binding domain-containing protein n=1 Tax=Linum trigynum TaxID=586398 RepID=A0AAV2G9F5_9ROSI
MKRWLVRKSKEEWASGISGVLMRHCWPNNFGISYFWGDRWVPNLVNQFIPSAPMGLPVDAYVCELVDQEISDWDDNLLESCFPHEVAQAIKQIPLRGSGEKDSLIWHMSKLGQYTVKKGYKQWLADFLIQNGVHSKGKAETWKKLWRLEVPPKVRQFMWRLAREILPTWVLVSHRNPRRGECCPFCDQRETQKHIFLECQWASRIWRRTDVARVFELMGDGTFYEWMETAMDQRTANEVEEWCVLLWYLWKESNAHLFNGAKLPEEEIPIHAKLLQEDYKQNQLRKKEHSPQPVRQGWRKPAVGETSVCTDAGILADGEAGLGVVIRDSEGRFIMAAAKRILGRWEAEVAEARAAEFGVQLAVQFRLPNVKLETDCLSIVHKLQNPTVFMDKTGVLCRSICRLLEATGDGRCSYTNREANQVAHAMAHVDLRWNERFIWLDTPPSFIINQL